MLTLYERMMTHAHEPSVTVPNLADAVGYLADDLQFAYWFLREQGLITRISNGNFQITVRGAAWVEDRELRASSDEPGGPESDEESSPDRPRRGGTGIFAA
jgi:hypothetical protein